MITPERVCKVLEGMYLLDLHYDNNFSDKVYMWCHVARDTCKNKHEDWQSEFLEAEKAILDALKAPSEKDCSLFYDPEFGDDRICECNHSYYRHFDSYDDMRPVGCKYCQCYTFKEKSNEDAERPK